MAKSKKKKSPGKKQAASGITIVSENRKAKHRYEILDSVECGMMLMGSEVKSMREGKLSLDEAHIRTKDRELWLIGADIAHYNNAGMWNHDPRRPRKLLVHEREYDKFAGRAHERGLTLIPLRVYFNDRGLAKCVMGLV
ncbi:MAG: SsrA-binding protein SmpB, partial [Planctomycetota bacterium]